MRFTICWPLAAGRWPLAAGCWLLAAGCWPLAAGCAPKKTPDGPGGEGCGGVASPARAAGHWAAPRGGEAACIAHVGCDRLF
ncbi:hypothetical protein EBL85_13335 [Marichromatium sp. AB32]|nr:hypothetical protein EBL85_13335 [Marichromatium sp. AB32]